MGNRKKIIMNRLTEWWWVFGIAGTVAACLNPYVGAFSGVYIFLFIFDSILIFAGNRKQVVVLRGMEKISGIMVHIQYGIQGLFHVIAVGVHLYIVILATFYVKKTMSSAWNMSDDQIIIMGSISIVLALVYLILVLARIYQLQFKNAGKIADVEEAVCVSDDDGECDWQEKAADREEKVFSDFSDCWLIFLVFAILSGYLYGYRGVYAIVKVVYILMVSVIAINTKVRLRIIHAEHKTPGFRNFSQIQLKRIQGKSIFIMNLSVIMLSELFIMIATLVSRSRNRLMRGELFLDKWMLTSNREVFVLGILLIIDIVSIIFVVHRLTRLRREKY